MESEKHDRADPGESKETPVVPLQSGESLPPAPSDPAPRDNGAETTGPSHPERTEPGWRTRVAALVRANGEDVAILVALGALTVLVRVLSLEGVGTGGDAIRKWHFVRQWFYRNNFQHAQWDHHMARLGVTGVAYVAQVLFGRSPNSYYIPQVSIAVLESWFVYACGKRLGGRAVGFIGAMLLIYFKGQVRAASQLMPEIFSGAYALIATYFFLRYADAVDRRRQKGWLVAMSVTLFVAYLAKETSVFFYPGFALAIWWARKDWRDLAIVAGILLLGLACEVAFYRTFTDYSNRFAVVAESHFEDDAKSEVRFWQLFDRYWKLDGPWRFSFYTFLPSVLGVVAFCKTRRVNALVAIVASYYLFLTFLVRRLHPLVIWQSFLPRYLDPTAPFVALVIAIFIVLAVGEIAKRHEEAFWTPAVRVVSRFGFVVALAITIVAGALSYADAKPSLGKNALKMNARIAAVVNDTYRRNLPIVAAKDPRGLWTIFNVFLDDRLLARKGRLPMYDDSKSVQRNKTFLVKNPKDYRGNIFSQMLKAHCYVEVSAKAGLAVQVNPLEPLGRNCDDVLRDAITPPEPPTE